MKEMEVKFLMLKEKTKEGYLSMAIPATFKKSYIESIQHCAFEIINEDLYISYINTSYAIDIKLVYRNLKEKEKELLLNYSDVLISEYNPSFKTYSFIIKR
jgi:hypothetical protein